MNKWSNRGNQPKIKLSKNSNKINSFNLSPKNKSTKIQNQKNSPKNKTISHYNSKEEKIIEHSIQRNYDQDGNSIVRTKIVREIGLDNPEENLNSKSIMEMRPKKNYFPYKVNHIQENNFQQYSNMEEENPEIMYDENYEIISPRSYNNKFKGTQQFKKIEISDRNIGEMEQRISPRDKGIINLKTGKISPVMLFNTPESEYEGQRSYYLGRNNNELIGNNISNISINKRIETTQRGYNNYNLESPYNNSNHSPVNDFNSPDRYDEYNYNNFRNIQIENIREKKPFQNKKLNKRNESSLEYGNNMNSTQEKYYSIPDGEDELYDMVDYFATLIQSNVRGFLVRKKVLRYITLAIYYQSFCDKLQDILSSHVKSEVLEILKNLPEKEVNNINNNKINIKNYKITKEEIRENNIDKNTPKKYLRKEYSESYISSKINNIKNYNKINNINKLRKDIPHLYNTSTDLNHSYNRTNNFKEYNNFQKSQSPSNRVFHYYIHSPCTKRSPHHRYYHEISSRTTNIKKEYGSNQINNTRLCNKCDEVNKMKKQDKFYITTTSEINQEEEEKQNEEYIIENKSEEEKINIEEINKYDQVSYNNNFTMRKYLEKDNYLSINIIKIPGKEKMSKNLSSGNILAKTSKSPNRISKVESINIKTTNRRKTEKEIEEEINRRVKITILEWEKNERDKKIKEEKKTIIIKKTELDKEKERKESERKEIERKEKLEKEKREREEFIKKERERKEKESKEKLEREKKERERKEKERKEKLERERKEREEFNKKEKERIEKERKEKIERERKEREEFNKKEKERREKERKEKLEKEKKEREEKIRKEREERYIKEKEERTRREEQLRIEREKQRKLKEEQAKKIQEKTKTNINQGFIDQTTTTTTKTINTKKVTYIKSNIDNSNNNKTHTNTNRNISTNIKTIKVNEEKKINMSDYILKKDCQKNLEEMKSKLEKEYQKKIEYEKNRSLLEQKKYEEKIEMKNKKEIERIIQEQKKKEKEIQKELNKEKEINQKKELELQKQREKEMKLSIQKELEKEKEIIRKKELEERNKKMKQIKINKVFEYSLKSDKNKNISKEKDINITSKKIELSEKEKNKNKTQAMLLLKKYILFRGNHLLKLRKYFNDWRYKIKIMNLIDDANIIKSYCKNMLEKISTKRAIKNWKKISQKIFYISRIKILKKLQNLNIKRKKIYELIRITKLTRIFSLRRFLHYIILIWYIYTQKIRRKRVNMKFLYENLLKTYMSLAKDIFGKDQFENPSVQDALYEAVNTNKFISMFQDDVPLARKHYEEMRKERALKLKKEREWSLNNIKFGTEKKETKITFYSKEKIDKEKSNNSIDEKRNEELLNKYKQYKSLNRDLIMHRKNRYINSIEKEDNIEEISETNSGYKHKNINLNQINNKNLFKEGNSQDNKLPRENKYIYQKTEISTNIYSRPIENKYEIKKEKNVGNNIKTSPNYTYLKTKEEPKSSSINIKTKHETNQINDKNNTRNKNSYSYKSKYVSSEENNIYKNNQNKIGNKIEIKTGSSSSGKDKNITNYSKSYKK